MGVRLSYEDAFTGHSSWDDVVARLGRYSLAEVLSYMSRVGAVLFASRLDEQTRTQQGLCQVFFGADARRIWDVVCTIATSRNGRGPVVAFDEVSAVTAAKLALMHLPPEKEPTGASMHHLGEALLMLNDLVDRTDIAPGKATWNDDAGLGAWAYFAYVNSAFRHDENWVHSLARWYDLFLRDRPALRQRPDYIDLPALAKEVTGLEPDALWALLFAFQANFVTISIDNAHQSSGSLSRRGFLSGFKFTPEEVDRIFDLVAQPVSALASVVRERYSMEHPRPYDVLPLAVRPLAVLGDDAYCVSPRLLFARMTEGFYHILLTGLPSAKRERLQRYVGDVFEDYVDELLRRALPRRRRRIGPVRYLGPRELREALPPVGGNTPSVCDAVVLEGDTAVLIEMKARFLPAGARGGIDRETFVERVKHTSVQAAGQLHATIQHIREGRLTAAGVPSDVREFVPVLLSLPAIPMSLPLFRFVRRYAAAAGYLTGPGVWPLEVLLVNDLEILEPALSRGTSLANTLRTKATSEGWREQSFNNFAFFTGVPGFARGHSPYLARRYEQLAEGAEAFLLERGMAPGDGRRRRRGKV